MMKCLKSISDGFQAFYIQGMMRCAFDKVRDKRNKKLQYL